MAVKISYSGGFHFMDGATSTNGDVHASPGNTIEFFSDNRFAIFIKGRIRMPAKRKKPPYSLRYVRHGSPAKDDQAVFASEPKLGKQRVFIKLKQQGIGVGDRFPYGVALLDDNDTIQTLDPQIIIQ